MIRSRLAWLALVLVAALGLVLAAPADDPPAEVWWSLKPITHPQPPDVRSETKLALRFKARGEGAVSFKIGGVTDGKHKSSLTFAQEAESSQTTLPAEFREFTLGDMVFRGSED